MQHILYNDIQKAQVDNKVSTFLMASQKINKQTQNKLEISNHECFAYDLLFGCPGWIEGVLQANAFIKSSMAKRCLVIGAETLSRVVDPHDRDSMIYSDGAGATVIEETQERVPRIAPKRLQIANKSARAVSSLIAVPPPN